MSALACARQLQEHILQAALGRTHFPDAHAGRDEAVVDLGRPVGIDPQDETPVAAPHVVSGNLEALLAITYSSATLPDGNPLCLFASPAAKRPQTEPEPDNANGSAEDDKYSQWLRRRGRWMA